VVKRQAVTLLALGGALSVVACGNILGLKDLEPYPSEGGTEEGGADGQEESSPDSPVMGSDAHEATTTDAREEDGAVVGDVTTDLGPPDVSGNDVVPTDSPQDTNPPMDSPSGCDAGTTLCGGKCINETSDGHNCGACGHDCLGGQCVSSTCEPFVYASSTDAFDIVIVNDTLYWVDQASTVWTCPGLATSCTPAALATGQSQPTRITYDGSSCLFWTNNGGGTNGSIGARQLGASLCPTKTGLGAPQGIAADANYVFWTDTATNQVTRLTRSGGATSATAVTMPAGVAIMGTTVYWANDGASSVQSSPESSWVPGTVAGSQSTPWAFSVTGSVAYWVDFSNTGSIWQTSGASSVQIVGAQFPIRIASDPSTIFWTEFGMTTMDGALRGCGPSNCTNPVTFAGSLAQPVGVALGVVAIYYGTTGDHRLWRLAL
jgi:hypothetical protein